MQHEFPKRHSEYLQWFTGIAGLFKKIHAAQEEKRMLKKKSGDILEYYIRQRESLGWPVSQAKKEELAAHCRRSINNL